MSDTCLELPHIQREKGLLWNSRETCHHSMWIEGLEVYNGNPCEGQNLAKKTSNGMFPHPSTLGSMAFLPFSLETFQIDYISHMKESL